MIFLKGIKSNYSIKKDFLKDLDESLSVGFGFERPLPSERVLNSVFFFLHPSCNCDHRKFVNFFLCCMEKFNFLFFLEEHHF